MSEENKSDTPIKGLMELISLNNESIKDLRNTIITILKLNLILVYIVMYWIIRKPLWTLISSFFISTGHWWNHLSEGYQIFYLSTISVLFVTIIGTVASHFIIKWVENKLTKK